MVKVYCLVYLLRFLISRFILLFFFCYFVHSLSEFGVLMLHQVQYVARSHGSNALKCLFEHVYWDPAPVESLAHTILCKADTAFAWIAFETLNWLCTMWILSLSFSLWMFCMRFVFLNGTRFNLLSFFFCCCISFYSLFLFAFSISLIFLVLCYYFVLPYRQQFNIFTNNKRKEPFRHSGTISSNQYYKRWRTHSIQPTERYLSQPVHARDFHSHNCTKEHIFLTFTLSRSDTISEHFYS